MQNLIPDVSEQELFQILSSPWRFGEAFFRNRDGTPRRYWPHQKIDLDDPSLRISHQDASDVGKSIDVATLILHFGFVTQGQQMLIAAPLTGHLRSIIEEVEWQVGQNEVLERSLNPTRGIVRQPYFTLRFVSGSICHFMPTGAEGRSYKSLHVEYIILDEAADVSAAAWSILYQRCKPGGRIRVYSYPNGRRDTPYYRITQSKRWKQYQWPMSLRPDWSPDLEAEKAEEFGGRDTPEYQHMVLGLHGNPVFHTFDLEAFYGCQKNIPEYQILQFSGRDFKTTTIDGSEIKLTEEEVDQKLKVVFPPALRDQVHQGKVWMGVDPGYTASPAEITIWRERIEPDRDKDGEPRKDQSLAAKNPRMVRILRVHMGQVPYPIQTKIIAALIRKYVPRAIGIDAGGNGTSVIQELGDRKENQDIPDIEDRLVSIDFGGVTIVDLDDDGTEHKQYTKELMTDLLNGAMRRNQAIWPKMDKESEDQFVNHTYSQRDKRIVYRKGHDHIIDADRCAFLAREDIHRLRELAGGFIEETAIDAVTFQF